MQTVFKQSKKLVLVLMALLHVGPALAETRSVEGVPTGWRLESYGEKTVALWHTPSACTNGFISLPAGASAIEHNRLYATILAAKMAKEKIFIYYNFEAGNCTIISYGTDA